MKILNFSSFLIPTFLCCIVAVATSCKKEEVAEEPSYVVEINIISPEEGAAVLAGQAFTVEVEYTRTNNTIHNVLIQVLDKDGNEVQKLMEQHVHQENIFTFKKEDVSIQDPGDYQIKASTTDIHGETDEEHGHEGGEDPGHYNVQTRNFTVE